jgi:serine/threonine protein kinase
MRCYGISQDPSTKNYIMVMPYAKNGSLRNRLNNKKFGSSLKHKVWILGYIAAGLKRIHEKVIIHRDLHSGNILSVMFFKKY